MIASRRNTIVIPGEREARASRRGRHGEVPAEGGPRTTAAHLSMTRNARGSATLSFPACIVFPPPRLVRRSSKSEGGSGGGAERALASEAEGAGSVHAPFVTLRSFGASGDTSPAKAGAENDERLTGYNKEPISALHPTLLQRLP
jgi:hypothetical protein